MRHLEEGLHRLRGQGIAPEQSVGLTCKTAESLWPGGWPRVTHRAASIMGGGIYRGCALHPQPFPWELWGFPNLNPPAPPPASAPTLLGMNPTGSHPEHGLMAEPQPSSPQKNHHGRSWRFCSPRRWLEASSSAPRSSLTGLGQLQLEEQVQELLDQPLAQEEFDQVDGDLLPALGRGGFIQEGDQVHLAILVGRGTTT